MTAAQAKPCTKCGSIERYKSGACKPCKREAVRAYRTRNPDKIKEAKNVWRAKNRDKERARKALWRLANPEKAKASIAAWTVANPNKAREATARYRARNPEKARAATRQWGHRNPSAGCIRAHNRRARANGGKLSKDLAQRLFRLQRGKCACGCGLPLGKNFHRDHRMPLALGGANEDWNMQLLRAKCNLQKNSKHPVDFMQSRGFLL